MPRKYKPTSGASFRQSDYEKDVRKAVRAVKRGITLREAAIKYKVAKSVVQRYAKQESFRIGRKGGQPALTKHQEEELVESILACADWCYPVSIFDVRSYVKEFLDKNKIKVPRFRDNFPGYDWATSFLTRHQARLSQRLGQNIKKYRRRVSLATIINSFFDELALTLDNVEPHLIINYDGSPLADDPGRRHLIFKRACKSPKRAVKQSKSSVSVMFSATASGMLLAPYIIYKSTNLYESWTKGGPLGWMDSTSFVEWFEKVIIPYCRRFEGKKLLIGDDLSSHMSPAVIKLCEQHDIHFAFLPANSTYLMQPLDDALFRPMKTSWKQVVQKNEYKSTAQNQPFAKNQFPSLLFATLKHMETDIEHNIKAGFSKYGIHPLDRSKVLANLPQIDPAQDSSGRSVTSAHLQQQTDSDTESEHDIEFIDTAHITDDTEDSETCGDLTDDELDRSDHELEDFAEVDHDLEHDDTTSGSLKINSWVRVEFCCGKRKTQCVGQVLRKVDEADCYVGSFPRESSKKANVFVFPSVPDEREFSAQKVITCLKTPTVRRGHHTFA